MIISEKKLCDLLEINNWFRVGTPAQFIKLLEANEQGEDLNTLATIIWTCSDGVSREDIYAALHKLESNELDEWVKRLILSGIYVDEQALLDDPYICYDFAC